MKQNVRLEYEMEQRSEHLEYELEQRSNPSSVNPVPVVYNYYYGSTCNNNNSGRGEFSGNSNNSTRPNDWNEKK